jgi:hypothetical protein
MAAIYQADIFCDGCADEIRERLWLESADGSSYPNIDEWEQCNGYDDERSYDSDEYPKGCSDDEESDCPEHCGGGEGCVNAEVFSDGTWGGYFFGNSLTSEGADYVRNAVRDDLLAGCTDSVAVEVWYPYYSWIDWEDVGDCEVCGAPDVLVEDDDGLAVCPSCEGQAIREDAESWDDEPGIDPCLGCVSQDGCAGCPVAIDGAGD